MLFRSFSHSEVCLLVLFMVSFAVKKLLSFIRSHLFMSSLVSFTSVLLFSEYKSFVSLGRFIPRYFILFVAMVNGSVSLISLSDFSSFVYKNARDFSALILYPATLPNSLISLVVFW